MATVFVNMGSNIESRSHIQNGLNALRKHFGKLNISKCYESKAIGFEGENFLNLAVSFLTELTITELSSVLRKIERAEGRQHREVKVWDSRTLDIDILLYDDVCGEFDGIELPRSEILEYAHVLLPLCELAGSRLHPALGISFAELSLEVTFAGQSIWEVRL